jgi:hypothetical protein
MNRYLKHYFLHWCGLVYAVDVYGYSKKDAINRFKNEMGLKRMPNNYAIWE